MSTTDWGLLIIVALLAIELAMHRRRLSQLEADLRDKASNDTTDSMRQDYWQLSHKIYALCEYLNVTFAEPRRELRVVSKLQEDK